MEFFCKLRRAAEKPQRVFRRHLQHIMDRFPAIANGEHVRFESLSVAGFARRVDILEEIHFQLLNAASFATFAPASGGIEREMACGESASQRIAFRGEESAHLVKGLQVGDRIRAWCATDGLLIDEFDAGQMFDPLNRPKLSHRQRLDTKGAGHGAVERVFDQCALA